jgi:chromate transporter
MASALPKPPRPADHGHPIRGLSGSVSCPCAFHTAGCGTSRAALTTWVTFAPCFLWVFALAPWIERLENARLLKGALALVTSAIVGVIANLSAWFALQVLFHRLSPTVLGPIHLSLPDMLSFDWRAGLIAAVSAWAIIGRKWNVIPVLALAAVSGWLLSQLS